MPINLLSAGGGTTILTTASSASNFTVTIPASTGTMVDTAATQTLTNKTLTSPTLTTPNINSAQVATVTGTAPIYMCRAWVNFNGTGTVAIRGSGNVSSITDNNTGNYTVNFTTAMPDANYAVSGSAVRNATDYNLEFRMPLNGTYTTSAVQVYAAKSTENVLEDSPRVCVAVFR
jgi:hypothetical protein